ncbi:glycosyltransferase [Mariniflexile sp. AS56]|uniref:glycosyltransferase n=1 Tax=Mariniflexile sp. AS56 TaxID=3063957 RepID=UPI0026F2814E|nr:glycosyltransferase [Mariniflexile sp. AS56]MDO7172160.1 glycosyltransferase [Mariniflexile sp. AS56]
MEKIKVVHVVEALGGGVYTYFKALSFFFGNIDKEVETFIIYSGNRGEINPSKIKEEFSSNIKLIEIPMVRDFSITKDIKATIQLTKTLKYINADVVHLHSSKAGVLGRISLSFLKNKKNVYYTPHGYSFIRTDISTFKKNIYKFIESKMNYFFGATTVACGDTEFEIASEIGKSKLIRNGVNIKNIAKHYKQPQNEKLTIGIVGRITEARNPQLFNNIALKYKDFNFIWIGDGNLRKEITAPNIKITGWLFNETEVLKHLSSIDVYMQTSLWEGLPIAILEAMALKKPIIATNIIGNKDIVLHNETGFLFEKIDDKLDEYFNALENENTRIRMGENGLKRCKSVFDINKNFNNLYLLYKEDLSFSK